MIQNQIFIGLSLIHRRSLVEQKSPDPKTEADLLNKIILVYKQKWIGWKKVTWSKNRSGLDEQKSPDPKTEADWLNESHLIKKQKRIG